MFLVIPADTIIEITDEVMVLERPGKTPRKN